MPKSRSVNGYLTDDGSFFPFKEDADLYEAIQALRFCVTQIGANPDKVMILVDGAAKQIGDYLHAKEAYAQSEGKRYDGNATAAESLSVDTAIDGGAETDNVSVLEQPIDIDEYVSDVGSRQFTETIHDGCTFDGVGSGRDNAPSIRRSAGMAVDQHTETASGRSHGGGENIRRAKVEDTE